MTKIGIGSDPLLELRDVEKQYGGLRPLRVREWRLAAGNCVMLLGFDRPAAEVFVNLITGATLPEKGDVVSLGRLTRDIADSSAWLSFVERFGIVSDRIVLLEAMTIAQNLAMSFDLEIDPIPADILSRVRPLAAEAGIDPSALETRVGDADPLLRGRVHIARALALDPELLVLEHPTATMSPGQGEKYAALVKTIYERRSLTTMALTMDEKFAKAAGGRLLVWQPATGDVKKRSIFGR